MNNNLNSILNKIHEAIKTDRVNASIVNCQVVPEIFKSTVNKELLKSLIEKKGFTVKNIISTELIEVIVVYDNKDYVINIFIGPYNEISYN